MRTLHLIQSAVGANRYRVEASLDGDGLHRQTGTAEFNFAITPQDREDLRWYLEDYLQYAADPAPLIAARIEGRMAELGTQLFTALFQGNEEGLDLWAALRPRLGDTRIEIITSARDATALPWELLRDPTTKVWLALESSAFVRAQTDKALSTTSRLPRSTSGPVRILLVICRPGGSDDVPFRSVANRLIKGLGESAREAFKLDMLRPPTFARLSDVLRRAKADGKPYHVVHFDGHGTYDDLNARYADQPPQDLRGYLAFENAAFRGNEELKDGTILGTLLADTDVAVLVLNACRSAHAEAPAAPEKAVETDHAATGKESAQAQAFGSLAQEVVDSGVAGVVAMRYNVYVVTAAQFIAELYAALANGQTLGEAVTLGRKQLQAQPLREIAYTPRPLQDWTVPIVYETAPVAPFPRPVQSEKLNISIAADTPAPATDGLTLELEQRPEAGFFGRDETMLALDRAFDTQRIVLLNAYAGSGKTSTAAEFARWYHMTGGIDGPALFTSFEHKKTLPQVLNETIGRLFVDAMEQAGIQWLALPEEDRLGVALNILAHFPVLWVWDNVEPIAGFPAGVPSAWSDAEQHALRDFLVAAKSTKAKILLTSRRDERGWLGELPMRINVPQMPMQERAQLARALAEKRGKHFTGVEDWMPLLRFTEGNPLTITVLVSQALRAGLTSHAQIEVFVATLREGERVFEDEATEGRAKSLGASLQYGFQQAFSQSERPPLAILHLFQGFVDVRCLQYMGSPRVDWPVREMSEMTAETWREILDRAGELGCLMSHGGGYYTVHPAVPWFFKRLFDQTYATSMEHVRHAFVDAIGQMGNMFAQRYDNGELQLITHLQAHEANLLYARSLAQKMGWWDELSTTMVGLRCLYLHQSRHSEWEKLVQDLVPDLIDPATGGPLPGRESSWSTFTDSRVRLAMSARRFEEAERLQRACLEWDLHAAAAAVSADPSSLNDHHRHAIERVGLAEELLGHILRQQEKGECVTFYHRAIERFHLIAERQAEGSATFNLAHAYLVVPAILNLDQAEQWYVRCLALWTNPQGKAACLGQLGTIAYSRFLNLREAQAPAEELLAAVRRAADLFFRMLALCPPDALVDLAAGHNNLGNLFAEGGLSEGASTHYQQALDYYERARMPHEAAGVRVNLGRVLESHGRLADARDYFLAALVDYQRFCAEDSEEVQDLRGRIAEVDAQLSS